MRIARARAHYRATGSPRRSLKLLRVLIESLPQRGELGDVGAKPIIEVVTKSTIGSKLIGGVVRRRHYSPLETLELVGTDGRKESLVEDAQEFDLHGNAHVPDLVEEEYPVTLNSPLRCPKSSDAIDAIKDSVN